MPCSICNGMLAKGSISGKLEKTGESVTMCLNCFSKFELVRPAKENIFRRKEAKQ